MEDSKKKNIYKLTSVIILCIMFLIMCLYASKESFWGDELDWTIKFLEKSNIKEMLSDLLDKGYNLPLYYLIMFPIYHIVPYGELWLLFPNFIAVIAGIYIINKIGKKISGNEDLGFISLCIAATSYILIYYGAFELRPYALLFCFSSLALYSFICKLQEPNNIKNNILYTLSLILLAYTHWFGCLIIVFYFFVDAFFWLRKKVSISFIFNYFILGIVFLPWFILLMKTHSTDFTQYWGEIPTIKSFFVVMAFLVSRNLIYALSFLVSLIILVIAIIKKDMNKFKNIFILIGSITWILLSTFIYSKYINPNGSLWVERYFFVILPHVFIISAISLSEILHIKDYINEEKISKKLLSIMKIAIPLIIFIMFLVIVAIAYKNYRKIHLETATSLQPFREISYELATTR